jgi:hypothetical protein
VADLLAVRAIVLEGTRAVTALGIAFELIRRRLGRVALAMRRERPSSQDRARG